MARIIQVGLGDWGFNWARKVVGTVAGAEVAAYVDAAPAAIARVQSELGVDPSLCYTSLAGALTAVECDLVLATLRTEAHFPVARQALAAGKHVVVEKPFTSTTAEAKELVALAEEKGRVLMVSQNYRYFPAPLMAADLMAGGGLGSLNLVGIDFRYHAPTMGYRYWEMPDPLLADMSIHHFDLMRLVLADNPRRISCRTWNPPGSPFAHDPIGVATIEFDRGAMVSYRGSWMSGGARTPWAGEWTMDFADGEIAWSSRDLAESATTSDRLVIRRRGEAPVEPDLPRLAYLDRAGVLSAAIQAVETGILPPRFPSGADNLGSLALVEAAILSASRGGATVEIGEVLD